MVRKKKQQAQTPRLWPVEVHEKVEAESIKADDEFTGGLEVIETIVDDSLAVDTTND